MHSPDADRLKASARDITATRWELAILRAKRLREVNEQDRAFMVRLVQLLEAALMGHTAFLNVQLASEDTREAFRDARTIFPWWSLSENELERYLIGLIKVALSLSEGKVSYRDEALDALREFVQSYRMIYE
ncbi:MAG: hypothetical protein AAB567_02980 [Patescibacteria group bacterium]